MSIYADDWNIYMFMLRISICCFWNNQNRSERELLQLVLSLGFGWLEAGLDYPQLKWKKKNVWVFFKALLLLCWADWICGTLQSACFPLSVVCFHCGSLSMGILAQWGLPHSTQHTSSKPGCNSLFFLEMLLYGQITLLTSTLNILYFLLFL